MRSLLLLPALLLPASAAFSATPPQGPIISEGRFPLHLQGICADGKEGLFWSWTNALDKTDLQGRLLRRVEADNHQGDLCYHEGRVYVAVNLGKFNQHPGQEDSWVYVYDAETLDLIKRQPVPELVHGAGGIGCDGRRFIVVGGLPADIDENYLYEYDLELRFVKRHVLASGQTHKGIQTAAWAHGAWWFGCYGAPKWLLRADADLQLTGRWEFDASLGIHAGPEGRFLIGKNKADKEEGYTGFIHRAVLDEKAGLRLVD